MPSIYASDRLSEGMPAEEPVLRTLVTVKREDASVWARDGPLPEGAEEGMSGWLLKQHQRVPGKWGKRWFSIDDRKGRLNYTHREGSRKVRASIPLQELSVSTTELSGHGHCFVVSCSPLRLVLSAWSEADQTRWVRNLQLRVDIWKEKVLAEGPRVAHVLEFDCASDISDESKDSSVSVSQSPTGFR
ncbi:hypothetical protein AB1Y20_005914 [Prymnesium parvum]|uniref:PH domain-containing protein n=1 Tax=Prymnesium parvum TaxID=97485 RepID=A0AB34J130_PRYPA|mmetsp:Transcript_37119/g.90540  ORF Transcript_37119/g.90540 Transcript_37119/m.90540 type:complete len:188 (-) Transcript_37119:108-671(-)|eukprot:CAMPEP_0205880290 /NCGR_PEP_ID=MMETSP1083-20121108/15861_1 /ASSEMBLY_ACC=CAM_ASM_000430 /TAXON_ID=97485 /ORGANISM="Prymnesium parvum, Strain Texoma1" /LENGTH=187 /DNA_ID=CAMNT_0053243325 /DNA_START=20 /DNA_END=583 /DNA_ORIENTATION=+